MDQKKDSVFIDIFDEKNTIELLNIKRNAKNSQKRKSSSVHSQNQRRRTKSFPIESANRNTRSRQYTPERKNTPPKQKFNHSKESKYIKKNNNPVTHNPVHIHTEEIKNDIDYREYKDQDTINWDLGCMKLPKDCLVYVSQMIIVGTVIGVSLYKLSATTDRPEFWASLLSGSVGYILPNPSLKKKG